MIINGFSLNLTFHSKKIPLSSSVLSQTTEIWGCLPWKVELFTLTSTVSE